MTTLGWRDDPRAVEADEALVLLPSLGTTTRLFDDLVAGLAARRLGLAIVRADLPGHGDGPLAACVDVRELAAEVAGVVAGMRARAITVAGVSMGGAIALEVARLAPRGLRGVVLVNSGARFGSPEGWAGLVDAVERGGMETTAAGAASGWFTPDAAVTPRARTLLADIPRIDPGSYVACCRALAAYDGLAGTEAIEVPATLLATADDSAAPPDGMRALARRLPRAEYFELPTGRHLSLVEHAVAVETILAHALGEAVADAA